MSTSSDTHTRRANTITNICKLGGLVQQQTNERLDIRAICTNVYVLIG